MNVIKQISKSALRRRSILTFLSTPHYSAVCRSCQLYRLNSTKASSPPSKDGFEDLDQPIKFTTSKAAAWKATNTHGGNKNDIPDIQPFVVISSVAAFLIYFLILREENDIDEEMKKPLWEKVPGLERQQLEMLLKYNTEHGIQTKEIRERLEIVRKQEDEIKRRNVVANK